MRKSPTRNALLNRLHKGVVVICVAVTLYGTGYLAMRGYRYLTVIRPEIKKKQLAENQLLLAEGSHENLKDNASVIST
ncbi:uncharacterized protein LOC108732921 [Agrilus planipennis]|uniref:Uncharacterized protein LOC108732921 n=1 Tax=Agrilus planipennis TaxID=224129 RepID=A0A1W4WH43_AGRPL|nr:uncharacterized protein LOC108732921 [Agrilus planipennis]